MRQRPGLFDRQLAELAECRLAPHAGVRAVLNHEYLAAGWCNLAQEARNERIPEFYVAGLGLRRVNDGLGEFDLRHEVLLKGPDSRGRLGARRRGTGAVCIAHRDMMEGTGLGENLLQQASSKSIVSPVRMPCSGLKSPVPPAAPPSAAAQPSGEHFMAWLKQGIASRRLIINDAKALVHTVSDTAYLVSPGVFQRYAQEHLQVATLAKQESQQDWQWVQKRFERLQLHRKQSNGLNIWTCEVTGPRKSRQLHGYLLEDAFQLLAEIPPNNPYLSMKPE